MNLRQARVFCTTAVLLVLFGCATTPSTLKQGADVPEDSIWTARGKIGVRSAREAKSASFIWHNVGEHYQIQVFGPLGQGRIHIDKDHKGVSLRRGDTRIEAENARALLAEATGIVMPVELLQSWIKGKAAPSLPVSTLERDEQGEVQAFQQAGWQIQIPKYHSDTARPLPAKLVASKDEYRLTLVIKAWQTGRS